MDGMPRPLTMTFPESSVDVHPESIFTSDTASIDMIQNPQSTKLTFTQTYANEMKEEKIFTFYPDKYAFDLEVKIHNLSKGALSESALLSWNQYVDPKSESDSYGHDGPISYIANSIDRYEVKKIESGKLTGPDIAWAGFESKYFIAAMVPQNPTLTSLALSVDPRNMVSVSLKSTPNIIPPGQVASFGYSLYLGPKENDILKVSGSRPRECYRFRFMDEVARHAPLDLHQISRQLCSQLRHRHYHPDYPDKDNLLAPGQ